MKKDNKIMTEKQIERRRKLIGTLKSLIYPTVIVAAALLLVYVILNFKNTEPELEYIEIRGYSGDGKDVVMENDQLLFTMDAKTTQFSLEVKDTGKVWHSNPKDALNDKLAQTEEKGRLASPLIMTYSVVAGLEVPFSSYAQSTERGIYEIEQGEDYVRVDYTLGNVEREYMIPPVITEENWLALYENISEEAQKFIKSKDPYKKIDINNLSKSDKKNESQIRADYPIVEETVIYVLRDNAKEAWKEKLEVYFEEAGYTPEDYARDSELTSGERTSDKPVFNVSVIYRLEGNDLVVEIPLKDLESRESTPIYTITPLPYFGAGGMEEEGYMLVPEGGGGLIRFNNGKTSQSSYFANVYGWDMCLTRDAVVHNTLAYYGVYGISEGENSFLCILEDGSSYASVRADISGKTNSYNYVNAVYSIKQREKYKVGDIANSDIYQYVQDLPDETLRQRYRFIDSGDYVDMAKVYSGYLQDEYGEALALNSDESTPVAVEIVGAVDKVRQILGVPVSKPLKLTGYSEAADIIKDLNSRGVGNLSVKLTGWANGGVKQKMLNSISTISDLGGKKGLQLLCDTAEGLGVDLYLNGITQYAYDSNIFDGFFSYRDAAKLISKERAELFEYNPVIYCAREGIESYWLLHTETAGRMADNLTDYAKDMGVGVSFQDIGMDLSADYYRKNPYSRDSVRKLHEARLKETSESGTKVMVNVGNDYTVPYASMVTNMDLRGSEYTILDECVPFFQLAVHGRVNYTGEPINICGNQEDELLYSAEYGAGLQFTFMKESAFALQKTLYTQYYGSSYDAWKDDMLAIYGRYNEELGHTFSQEMTGHRNITSVVSCTEYADGTKVYVNYGFSEADVEGVTVPARDYLVVR